MPRLAEEMQRAMWLECPNVQLISLESTNHTGTMWPTVTVATAAGAGRSSKRGALLARWLQKGHLSSSGGACVSERGSDVVSIHPPTQLTINPLPPTPDKYSSSSRRRRRRRRRHRCPTARGLADPGHDESARGALCEARASVVVNTSPATTDLIWPTIHSRTLPRPTA